MSFLDITADISIEKKQNNVDPPKRIIRKSTPPEEREWKKQDELREDHVFLVEFMYPVLIACQVELSQATRVYVVVCLFKVWRQLYEPQLLPIV